MRHVLRRITTPPPNPKAVCCLQVTRSRALQVRYGDPGSDSDCPRPGRAAVSRLRRGRAAGGGAAAAGAIWRRLAAGGLSELSGSGWRAGKGISRSAAAAARDAGAGPGGMWDGRAGRPYSIYGVHLHLPVCPGSGPEGGAGPGVPQCATRRPLG